MGNRFGNLQGSGGGSKSSAEAYKKRRKSEHGYYKLAFVENYAKITERDIELRLEYAKDAVGRFMGVPKQMVTFRKKSTKQTTVSLDEILYVKVGVDTVGKISIRVLRAFSYSNMDIIFQVKRLQDRSDTKYSLSRRTQGRSKSYIRAQTKKRRKKSKMTR